MQERENQGPQHGAPQAAEQNSSSHTAYMTARAAGPA